MEPLFVVQHSPLDQERAPQGRDPLLGLRVRAVERAIDAQCHQQLIQCLCGHVSRTSPGRPAQQQHAVLLVRRAGGDVVGVLIR